MNFQTLFSNNKPIFGMIHLDSFDSSAIEVAKAEIETYLEYGVYPLIENYFGSADDCEEVLKWMHETHPDAIYGVNILGNYRYAFELAKLYGAKFIQIDSVCGHLPCEKDDSFADSLQYCRKECDVVLLGGVRFKYQPVLSGRSLTEDLTIGMQRCDAIVCTGEGTGIETPIEKIDTFKTIIGDFPVIVGAGVTLETAKETASKSNGAIVGSWFKHNHSAQYKLNPQYVAEFVKEWQS